MGLGGAMKSAVHEREPRIPESFRCLLEYDDFSSACLVENLSSGGFLLECLDEFMVGQRMQLACKLRTDQMMRCRVEVRHVAGARVGTAIVEIDDLSARLCRERIEEYYALQLKSEPT